MVFERRLAKHHDDVVIASAVKPLVIQLAQMLEN